MGGTGSVLKSTAAAAEPIDTKPEADVDFPVFVASQVYWPGCPVAMPDTFKLKINYESLDFLRTEDDRPIVQLPYQHILCWGSTHSHFQFKIFSTASSTPQQSPTPVGAAAAEAEISAGGGEEGAGEDGSSSPGAGGGALGTAAAVAAAATNGDRRKNNVLITMRTSQGRSVEDALMIMVKKLMKDMATNAISKEVFAALMESLFDERGALVEQWRQLIEQFTAGGRLFLANQGMELLASIGAQAPFEKFDLACFLYEKIINKDSYQLLVNTFEDEKDRENLIHRLKLPKTIVVTSAMSPKPVK